MLKRYRLLKNLLKTNFFLVTYPNLQMIDTMLSRFGTSLLKIFKRKQGKPNLNKCQRTLLEKLVMDDSIVYCHSDKGLGPVAVNLKQYIMYGLTHLKNRKAYRIISEAEARDATIKLKSDLLDWTINHRKSLDDSAVDYLRKHIDKTSEDP